VKERIMKRHEGAGIVLLRLFWWIVVPLAMWAVMIACVYLFLTAI